VNEALFVASAVATWLAGANLAPAQNARPPAAAPAAPASPAQTAFETLKPEERRAIQRDLVWAAGFSGAITGEFGPLTLAAIRRFETAQKSSADGLLSPAERTALAKLADARREAAGFRIETDRPTGMKIGVPTKIFTKRSGNAFGSSRWQDKDEKVTLDLQILKPEDELAQIFERGTDARVAGRKITYKLLRPDFFVISGETEKGKFYRRMEKPPQGPLRGFSIGYDKAIAAEIDPLVVAIATSFEAMPQPSGTPSAVADAPVSRPSAPEPRTVTAVRVQPGRALTSAPAIAACKALIFGSNPVQIVKREEAGGLILLAVPEGAVAPIAPALALPALAIQRDGAGKLLTTPIQIAGETILAPLQKGGAGAPLFDGAGQLTGLVLSAPPEKIQVAGVVPALGYRFAGIERLRSFAELPAPEAAEPPRRPMGAIAAERGPAVLSLRCQD
jgi:hypothetical protein